MTEVKGLTARWELLDEEDDEQGRKFVGGSSGDGE